MSTTRDYLKNDSGFTLVELMVTVFLTAIAVISIYRGYTSFSQAADAQQQVMEMQQNLRIGITTLARDIRRAGMNMEDITKAGFVFDATTKEGCTEDLHYIADPDELAFRAIVFTMDSVGTGYDTDCIDNDDDGISDKDGSAGCTFDPDDEVAALEALEGAQELLIGDGDVDDDGERIKYQLQANGDTFDLQRSVWKSGAWDTYTLITNVEALNFVYFDDTGGPPLSPSVEIDAATGVQVLKSSDADKVDRVEITLVVRATNEDYRYTDNVTYSNMQGTPLVSNKGDNFRRRAFSMSVQIRNNI